MKFSQIRPFVRYARRMELLKNEGYPPMLACDARLFYAIEGEGVIEVNKTEYEMEKGALLIFEPGVEYSIKSPKSHVSYIALNFDMTFSHADQRVPVPPKKPAEFSPEDIIEEVEIEDAPELSCVTYLADMHMILGRIVAMEREYAMNVIFHETKISAMLCDVLCDTLRHLRSEALLGGEGKLDDIIRYVHEHHCEPLTNESLGEYFGFHKNYISSLVKEYTGMPLHRYLNHVRLSRAVDLLNGGEESVTEIARRCGFCDIYYFSRYFKRRFGVSPTEYRKNRG